ncbi:MAG: hypothetical protein IPL35_02330 [Sphingobacteriales bacterium]|nr:hypothetical protein [Sphingobacteriales bacterium]
MAYLFLHLMMSMRFCQKVVCLLAVVVSLSAVAQSSSVVADSLEQGKKKSPVLRREYGLNISPFAFQFLPISKSTDILGPTQLMYKKYRQNGKIFRMGVGLNIDVEENSTDAEEENSFFVFRIGAEYQRHLGGKWYYLRGTDFTIYGGHFNTGAPKLGDLGTGVYFSFGTLYRLTEYISFSTETAFFIGLGVDAGFHTQWIPPLSITGHFSFKKI